MAQAAAIMSTTAQAAMAGTTTSPKQISRTVATAELTMEEAAKRSTTSRAI